MCAYIHIYTTDLKVNIMLDRETISRQDIKSLNSFNSSIGSFMDCLERTKEVLDFECNGDFEHYKSCVNRAIKLLN